MRPASRAIHQKGKSDSSSVEELIHQIFKIRFIVEYTYISRVGGFQVISMDSFMRLSGVFCLIYYYVCDSNTVCIIIFFYFTNSGIRVFHPLMWGSVELAKCMMTYSPPYAGMSSDVISSGILQGPFALVVLLCGYISYVICGRRE